MNGSKGSLNPTGNGERGRSLLCGREALARPSGMAENTQRGSDLTSGDFDVSKFFRVSGGA